MKIKPETRSGKSQKKCGLLTLECSYVCKSHTLTTLIHDLDFCHLPFFLATVSTKALNKAMLFSDSVS